MGWNSTMQSSKARQRLDVFQFPMGWNSTLRHGSGEGFCRHGFNSQWDGILLGFGLGVALGA